jgi:hypothetical protein
MYLYIKVAKSFVNVPREKLSPRQNNLEDVKGFRTSKLCFVSNIKITLMAVVKSNGREIGFRGGF